MNDFVQLCPFLPFVYILFVPCILYLYSEIFYFDFTHSSIATLQLILLCLWSAIFIPISFTLLISAYHSPCLTFLHLFLMPLAFTLLLLSFHTVLSFCFHAMLVVNSILFSCSISSFDTVFSPYSSNPVASAHLMNLITHFWPLCMILLIHIWTSLLLPSLVLYCTMASFSITVYLFLLYHY